MSSAIIEPKLGRVAKTSKPNITDAITALLYAGIDAITASFPFW